LRLSDQLALLVDRAGLYKQLAELKALVAEYREDPAKNAALKVGTPNHSPDMMNESHATFSLEPSHFKL